MNTKETNPIKLFYKIAGKDFVRIHGPEHHFLDGACILTAFYNSGGEIDLEKSLIKLLEQSNKMPGAMCGQWGVCGAVTSVGAALAIIDNTGPLSTVDWGLHMKFTSKAVLEISQTGGPRCCKRDAFFAIRTAVDFINENYGMQIPGSDIKCAFSRRNEQCLKERCPFYGKN
ncbi:MAG: hypothetical protein IJ297_03090 [Clostridia bacterium]|nr:hypothetical protein [Clostridia bacterium]